MSRNMTRTITAANLDPGDRNGHGYPHYGHGRISLTALFDDSQVIE